MARYHRTGTVFDQFQFDLYLNRQSDVIYFGSLSNIDIAICKHIQLDLDCVKKIQSNYKIFKEF